jgi:pSer/pThr/pTyr-binding forkhead associated (FHA) protein
MALCKVCPTCGTKNPPEEPICIKCMTDLTAVAPIECEDVGQKTEHTIKTEDIQLDLDLLDLENEKTIILSKSKLVLKGHDFEIVVHDGDIVGRHAVGGDFLQRYKTVSRKHAKFFYKDGKWYVQDLGSTNGTYLNGIKLLPMQEYPLSNGDKLSLSGSLEFTVNIYKAP